MSAHKRIPKKIRQQIFEKYNGHCAYCGCELTMKTMQVDHIYSVYHAEMKAKGMVTSPGDAKDENGEYIYDKQRLQKRAASVNDIDNLMPACRQCNFYKGAMDIETFRNALETTLYENTVKPFQFRLAEKYGFVQRYPHKIQFYFEKEKKENCENHE